MVWLNHLPSYDACRDVARRSLVAYGRFFYVGRIIQSIVFNDLRVFGTHSWCDRRFLSTFILSACKRVVIRDRIGNHSLGNGDTSLSVIIKI